MNRPKSSSTSIKKKSTTTNPNRIKAHWQDEKNYLAILDNLPDLVLVHRDGIILYVNPAMVNLWGLIPEKVLNTSVLEYIPKDYHSRIADVIRKRKDTGQEEPYMIEFNSPVSGRRTILIRGSTIKYDGSPAILNVITDITDQKAAQDKLWESEEKFRSMVEASPDVIWEIDLQGNFTYISPHCLEQLGYTQEDLIGKSFFPLIRPEFLPAIQNSFFLHVQEKRSFNRIDVPANRQDGSQCVIEIRSISKTGNDGQVKGFFGIARDITENKKAEEDLHVLTRILKSRILQRTDELEQEIMHRKAAELAITTSLNEKEILLREIHHRVKNNLQIITSLIRLQKQQITDPGTMDVLQDSESRIRSMALIHEKLYRSTDLTSIDFSDYIRTLSSSLISAYAADPHRIRLIIDVKDLSLDINRAIPAGLIMNELISNALKHAFPGDRTGEINITGKSTPEGIVLSVQDNGVGLPEGMDWKNTSTLGLHLVITLINQLKGSVEMNSDRGTVFDIIIPSANEEIS